MIGPDYERWLAGELVKRAEREPVCWKLLLTTSTPYSVLRPLSLTDIRDPGELFLTCDDGHGHGHGHGSPLLRSKDKVILLVTIGFQASSGTGPDDDDDALLEVRV